MRVFVNRMRELMETTIDVFYLLFHPVHYWLELDSIRGFQDIEMRLPKLFKANFTGKIMEV